MLTPYGKLLSLAMLMLVAAPAAADEPSKPAVLPPAATRPIDYAADIRPIFARACFQCHGPDKQRSGFRLDQRAAAMRGGDIGPAIVPGKSADSPLVEYIAGLDADLQMPPEGPQLSAEEIGLVRAWIDQGAAWPEAESANEQAWWSLQPLVRPKVPDVSGSNAAWPRSPVDAFILARLHAKHLEPSPEADRRTLMRRLYFDLVGLPPTPDEVDAFLADRDPRAYEKLVDRLLASPRYGERWARHWLDVVRYGDSHGYDKDQPRPDAWPYRDYVIRALNEDKPYARFVQEQVAGDVLFPDTRDGIEALGFIAAGPWDLIGHAEVPETKIDGKIARLLDRDDMVSNTMNTFTSLTVQCARCHNHKFDPVSQEDYYSLQAVFAALDRANKLYDVDPVVAQRRQELGAQRAKLAAQQERLRAHAVAKAGAPLADVEMQIAGLQRNPNGKTPRSPAYGYHSRIEPAPDAVKWVELDLGQPSAIERIVLHACDDDYNGIGAGFGFPVRFKVELSDDPKFTSNVVLVDDHAQLDFANPGLEPLSTICKTPPARYLRVTATKLALRQNDYILALAEIEVFDAAGRNLAAGAKVTALDTIQAPPRWRSENVVDGDFPQAAINDPKAKLEKLRNQREQLVLGALDKPGQDDWQKAKGELAALDKQLASLPAPSRVYAGTIHQGTGSFRGTGPDGGKPRVIRVLRRGDVREPKQEVGPGTVAIIPGARARFELATDAGEGERRAALARWLTDRRNPLTWRSIANRVWHYHFGRGLVETPNDFGRMGRLPSHPELLDWLAVEFRNSGGSLKQLHRLIVTSAVYRQSSATQARFATLDAGNELLWRMNRRRLEAEAIRDAVLAVAGKLDLKLGGPGYRDFVIEQPAHSPHYEYHLHNPDDAVCHRRSIYRFIVRSQPQPFMTTLDCADPSMSVNKRNESLTVLQALALWNDRMMVVMAGHFAERLEQQASDPASRIEAAYRLALARRPTSDERDRLVRYAREFGLANACRLIFNLSEFVFVD